MNTLKKIKSTVEKISTSKASQIKGGGNGTRQGGGGTSTFTGLIK